MLSNNRILLHQLKLIEWIESYSVNFSTAASTWRMTSWWTGSSSISTPTMMETSPGMSGSLVSMSSLKVKYGSVDGIINFVSQELLMNKWTFASQFMTSMMMDISGKVEEINLCVNNGKWKAVQKWFLSFSAKKKW